VGKVKVVEVEMEIAEVEERVLVLMAGVAVAQENLARMEAAHHQLGQILSRVPVPRAAAIMVATLQRHNHPVAVPLLT